MNLIRYFSIGLMLSCTTFAATKTYVSEDFEAAHDVGHAPAWPVSSYSPAEKDQTDETYIVVVDGAENKAGSGLGVKLRDYDKRQVRFAYDFTENSKFQLSTLRFGFDFAFVDGVPGGADMKVVASRHGSTFNGRDRQLASACLTPDGRFALDPEKPKNPLDVSSGSHHLDVFVNDLEEGFAYTAPGGGSATLGPNAADWYIDGKFAGSNPLFLKQTKGTVGNFGRVGVMTGKGPVGVCYVFDNFEVADLNPVPTASAPGTSWLAQLEGGRLKYGKYANQGQGNAVHTLPDFSRCGYMGGGVAIPFVAAAVALEPSGGDDTTAIQAALDKVAAMPVQANGFRGAVLLKAGTYRLTDTLDLLQSGVVLRGEGTQKDGGTKLVFSTEQQMTCIRVAGSDYYKEDGSTLTRITDRLVPVGAGSFSVGDASRFRAGDRILVYNRYNQKWIDDIYAADPVDPAKSASENPPYGWTAEAYSKINNPRRVVGVEGNRIVLDAPVCNPIEGQYGGGEIVKYRHDNRIEQVGIENLRIEAAYSYPLKDDMPWAAVSIRNCENFWVRQVTGQYIGKNLVNIGKGAHFGTVEDCAMLDYRGVLKGGGRYGFSIDNANYILFQRCYARNGRHDFIVGSKCPGPNAFVDCGSEMALADIGPHSRWSMGFLWDNVKGQRIQMPNRRDTGSGHGWAGAQHLFWNCESTVMMCDAPPGAMNWSVGCSAAKIEGKVAASQFGIWDSQYVPVAPRSLYYTQLKERLGNTALRNVVLPQQVEGRIWDGLFDWAGEGLLFDDVVIWHGQAGDHAVKLSGVVRNLTLLGKTLSVQWSRVSGPGEADFSSPSSLETQCVFSKKGSYKLQLTVDGGSSRITKTIRVEVGR